MYWVFKKTRAIAHEEIPHPKIKQKRSVDRFGNACIDISETISDR